MKITRFEDLDCWLEARKLVNMLYDSIRQGKSFQNDYRLRDQCIGAAISTMGNIPEGFARRSNREFIQFLFIAVSSAAELQSHMYVALDQNYVSQQIFKEIYDQAGKTSRLISGLITYLRNNERNYKRNKPAKPNKPDKPEKPEKPCHRRLKVDPPTGEKRTRLIVFLPGLPADFWTHLISFLFA